MCQKLYTLIYLRNQSSVFYIFFQLHIPWFNSFDHSNFFNDHILFKDHNNRKLTKDLFPVFFNLRVQIATLQEAWVRCMLISTYFNEI